MTVPLSPPDLARSYLWWISGPFLLWVHHLFTAIAVTFAFMVGFMTRITAPAAWFLQLMYLHRLTGALFGLGPNRYLCGDVLDDLALRQLLFRRRLVAKDIRRATRVPVGALQFLLPEARTECCGERCDPSFSDASLRDLSVWRVGESSRRSVVGRHGGLVRRRQLRVSVVGHDLDGLLIRCCFRRSRT